MKYKHPISSVSVHFASYNWGVGIGMLIWLMDDDSQVNPEFTELYPEAFCLLNFYLVSGGQQTHMPAYKGQSIYICLWNKPCLVFFWHQAIVPYMCNSHTRCLWFPIIVGQIGHDVGHLLAQVGPGCTTAHGRTTDNNWTTPKAAQAVS